ncbi:hypothetical protein D9M69_477470 [compost metagenome]
MEHRHGMQEHRVAIEEPLAHGREAGERQVVVADHHAFGEAGGAAGVEDAQQGIATAAGIGDWLGGGQQRLARQHAGGCLTIPGVDQGAQGPGLLEDAQAYLDEGLVDYQHGGFGVVQGIGNLGQTPAGIHRIQHAIAPRYAECVFDIALRIAREHGDAFAAGHAQGLQGAGQARDTLAEFGEGDAATLVADGRRVGPFRHVAVQPLGDIHPNLRISCS